MNGPMMANVGLVVLNTILLSVLLVLFARILREVRTRFTLGLIAFAGVLWVQNVFQLYFYATMMDYYAGGVEGLVLVQNLLATLASLFLVTVTLSPAGAGGRLAAPE